MKKDTLPILVVKSDPFFSVVAIAMLAALVLAFTTPSHAAEKKTRTKERAGTYQDSNGNSGTFDSTTTRSQGELQRNGSWTNQNGQTGTHTLDRKFDKSTGTGTVSASTTGVNGKTESREGTLAKNSDGSVSGQGTITGPNGKVSTYSDTTVKTDTGSSTKGTITGPNGKTGSFDTEVSKTAPGDVSRDTTVTGPNGKSTEKVVDTKMNGDGTGTRTIEVTKPDGATETRTENFTETASNS